MGLETDEDHESKIIPMNVENHSLVVENTYGCIPVPNLSHILPLRPLRLGEPGSERSSCREVLDCKRTKNWPGNYLHRCKNVRSQLGYKSNVPKLVTDSPSAPTCPLKRRFRLLLGVLHHEMKTERPPGPGATRSPQKLKTDPPGCTLCQTHVVTGYCGLRLHHGNRPHPENNKPRTAFAVRGLWWCACWGSNPGPTD